MCHFRNSMRYILSLEEGIQTVSYISTTKRDDSCIINKYRYGYRKITAILRNDQRINHKALQRIMQKYNWQCRVKVKKRKQTGQPYYIAPNTLNREFAAQNLLKN